MGEEKKRLPVGLENFEQIINDNYYYVDKTGLISELIRNGGMVNLFTRPRRFGKTLNMSMLEHFFSIERDQSIYDGLEISKDTKLCEEYMGKYPVISISLKGINAATYEDAFDFAVRIMKKVARNVQFLLGSDALSDYDKLEYKELLNNNMSEAAFCGGLKILSELLEKHYGTKVVLLIDEYDVPLAKAFENGDYRGQQKLVPDGQEQDISKKVTTVIEAPDGTTSTPLSKERAKELQEEAQSGKWNDLNWNEYKTKDVAIGIGKQTGQAALMGAAIGVGFDVAQKVWNGEEIKGEELVETAILSGADFGVKAAAAGALKVGVEKGIVKAIPKGTPAGTCANIAHVAIENAKIIGKMATGELTIKEGFEKMEQTTVATVAGIAASTKGVAIGAAVGSVLGPVGSVVGGFIGGTVGYMAGSKVGETVVKGVQKIRSAAKEAVKAVATTAYETASSVVNGIGNLCSNIAGFFGF